MLFKTVRVDKARFADLKPVMIHVNYHVSRENNAMTHARVQHPNELGFHHDYDVSGDVRMYPTLPCSRTSMSGCWRSWRGGPLDAYAS